MIEIKKISKSFGKVNALQNVNILVNKGKIFSITGPNGSGKSTLIKSLLGQVIPDKGTITIDNDSIKNKWEYKNDISYMPQIIDFPANLRVNELIEMIKTVRLDYKYQNTTEVELIKIFELEPFLDKKLSDLSGGTKQKVNIVLTFMFNVPTIVLDEPTSGLDPVSMIKLKELIKERNKAGVTFIITSHIMSFIENISKEIIFLIDGSVAFDGKIHDLKKLTNKETLERSIAELMVKKNV